MDTAQTKSIKGLKHLRFLSRSIEPTVVPRAQAEGPILSIEPDDAHGGYVGVGVDMEIGEQSEAPDSSTLVEGT